MDKGALAGIMMYLLVEILDVFNSAKVEGLLEIMAHQYQSRRT